MPEIIRPGMTIEQMQTVGRANGAEAAASVKARCGDPATYTGIDFSGAVYPGPRKDPTPPTWDKRNRGRGINVPSTPTEAGKRFLEEQRRNAEFMDKVDSVINAQTNQESIQEQTIEIDQREFVAA